VSTIEGLARRLVRMSPRVHRFVRRVVHRSPVARSILRKVGLVTPAFRPRTFLLQLLPPHSVGAEIGVHVGDFSAEILRVVNPARLHLIDPWQHHRGPEYQAMGYGGQLKFGQGEMDDRYEGVLSRFRRDRAAGRVIVHRGASVDVSAEFPEGYFDWVYIDGNHFYDFVKQDLERYYPKLKVGGYLAGDDYMEGWWKDGVRRAVTEFIETWPVDVITLREEQFVLRRRS